jgi:carboxyl-terminal processing protease
MKVVKALDEQNVEQEHHEQEQITNKKSGYVHIKKFHFILILFFLVLLSTGITTFALSFGEEKVITVGTERSEFDKLYAAYDTLKSGYFEELNQKKTNQWGH